MWDVFVSHCHTDGPLAERITEALTRGGLRVFRAVGSLGAFESISDTVLDALHGSRILLACYSAEYPTRPACQHEFGIAYLAGQREGNPLGRVLAVNPEHTLDHIQPRQLRDVLLPAPPLTPAELDHLVSGARARVAATTGPIGQVPDAAPRWHGSDPVHPPVPFAGRWSALWRLHSALHPDVGMLTSPPGTSIAVVHGPAGIGKTALVAEYVRRFGAAYPDGVVWRRAPGDSQTTDRAGRRLRVLDEVTGPAHSVVPLGPGPVVVISRDARLAALGTGCELTDLSLADSGLLAAAHRLSTSDQQLAELCAATAGSPELRGRTIELAVAQGLDVALDRVSAVCPTLLAPVRRWLAPELASVGDTGWDVLRVLAAAAPAAVAIPRVADVLAATRDTDRLRELLGVQVAAEELLARGVVPGQPDTIELALPAAVALALRGCEDRPHHAERIRRAVLNRLASSPGPVPEVAHQRHSTDAERDAAHLVQTELLGRVTGQPLGPQEGSLREALTSLHAFLLLTREAKARVPPAARRFHDITGRLMNDVLRPVLNHWHIELGEHEDLRPAGVSRIAHERDWYRHAELRAALRTLHRRALDVAAELGAITGHPSPGELRSLR
jgi:hypothetical protein